jgi:CubicO group peptidase (beta-lactamase class C family)
MYLKVQPAADGTMRAFLKNPERNIGYITRVAALEREGATIRLLAAATKAEPRRVLAEGVLRDDVLSIPLRGGTYDFRRVDDRAESDFYPRSRPGAGAQYRYRTPPLVDDGWPVATAEEVGMARAALETFVRTIIDTPIDSISAMETHGVLIARHGKLVLEEYFHGEHRDKPHDTRSAAKVVATALLGATIHAGAPLSAQSFVYQAVNGGTFASDLEPRKRALVLEHLLTMSSGLDCDDNDENSPGAEDRVSEQTEEPDWWKLTLGLSMTREPGERAVYASLQPNLVGCVIRAESKRPLVEVFHELLAEPLQIRRYWMNLMPLGEAYLGGGIRFLPRDFMKFGQLMLDGGRWGKHRVVSQAWAERATSSLVDLGRSKYGYLWWIIEYPYQGGTIRAFYAGGNGGQVVMGIPDLDIVVAFYGGNYNDRVMFQIQRHLIPEYVLPAVVDR